LPSAPVPPNCDGPSGVPRRSTVTGLAVSTPFRNSAPPPTVVAPVKSLVFDKVNLPGPALINLAAPEIEPAAAEVAKRRKNVRVLACGPLVSRSRGYDLKRVGGGLLVQTPDETCLDDGAMKVVTRRAPTEVEMADLLFAWKVAWFVKSNAIVYARGGTTIGVGAGQMSRVVSARIAGLKAADEGLSVPGSVMASDAFFPFRDGIDAAATAGVTAVIQPGGSVRDDEVIAAADDHGLAMVFTGLRHFRH